MSNKAHCERLRDAGHHRAEIARLTGLTRQQVRHALRSDSSRTSPGKKKILVTVHLETHAELLAAAKRNKCWPGDVVERGLQLFLAQEDGAIG